MPIETLFTELGEPAQEPWCLAFSNTVSSRGEPGQQDRLTSLEALRAWLLQKGVLDENASTAGEDPRTLDRAIRLREAIFGIAEAISSGQEPEEDDLSELNWNVQRAIVAARLLSGQHGLEWDIDSLRNSVSGSVGVLALSAAGLFSSEKSARVRKCNDQSCGWLFVDLSKNRSRKWCDMSDCGNVAKARRYYAKQKALKAST
ncbi:MAG: hypothetical protein QOJ65_2837 [Fimbriimonadaceae bacterium]|jgi:predicted RNA-binding Zn ribbon-like protein|nr:hypothetical protein [Fimbriimonadaceae bacterium]